MRLDLFITSYGRTATQWLAWLLNQAPRWEVQWESSRFHTNRPRKGMVSSPSLENLLSISVPYPVDFTHKFMITRELTGTALSWANMVEAEVHESNRGAAHRRVCEMQQANFNIVDQGFRMGVRRIDYERFSCVDYMQAVVDALGIRDLEVRQSHLDTKLNQRPRVFERFEDIPQQYHQFVEGMAPLYHKWRDDPSIQLIP